MLRKEKGFSKWWKDFSDHDLYRHPIASRVFTDLCLRDGDRRLTGTTVERLMAALQLSKPSVLKALRLLEQAGFIYREVDSECRNRNVIRLNFGSTARAESGKQDLPTEVNEIDQSGKKDLLGKRNLPSVNEIDQSGKRNLPSSDNEPEKAVNEIYQVGKRDLPTHLINSKELLQEYIVDETRAREGDFVEEFFSKREQIARLCRELGVSADELRRVAREVADDWELTGKRHDNRADALSHLLSTIRIKVKLKKQENNDTASKPTTRAEDVARLVHGAAATIARRESEGGPDTEPVW